MVGCLLMYKGTMGRTLPNSKAGVPFDDHMSMHYVGS